MTDRGSVDGLFADGDLRTIRGEPDKEPAGLFSLVTTPSSVGIGYQWSAQIAAGKNVTPWKAFCQKCHKANCPGAPMFKGICTA